MASVPLDQIKFRRIGSVPDRRDGGAMIRETSLHHLRAVNRTVIQKEKYVAPFVLGKDMLQERNEFRTAFTLCKQKADSAGQCIQRSKDWRTPVLTSGRNQARFANRPPHPAQTGVEMEFAFVLEEKGVALWFGCGFFKADLRCRLARCT